MLQIAVVDENPFIARQVGQLVERAGHCVMLCRTQAPHRILNQGNRPDLVLIGQRSRDENGWTWFTQWQETDPGRPLMLYVLDDCQPGGMSLLSQALEIALAEMRRPRTLDSRHRSTAAGGRPLAVMEG